MQSVKRFGILATLLAMVNGFAGGKGVNGGGNFYEPTLKARMRQIIAYVQLQRTELGESLAKRLEESTIRFVQDPDSRRGLLMKYLDHPERHAPGVDVDSILHRKEEITRKRDPKLQAYPFGYYNRKRKKLVLDYDFWSLAIEHWDESGGDCANREDTQLMVALMGEDQSVDARITQMCDLRVPEFKTRRIPDLAGLFKARENEILMRLKEVDAAVAADLSAALQKTKIVMTGPIEDPREGRLHAFTRNFKTELDFDFWLEKTTVNVDNGLNNLLAGHELFRLRNDKYNDDDFALSQDVYHIDGWKLAPF